MKLTIEQALQQGVAAHKEGKLQEAERLYLAILESQPLHPEANHNLGILAFSVNKVDAALPFFKTALEAKQDAKSHYNLGITLKELGRLEEAEASLKQAIAMKPDYALAHHNLGITLKKLGKLEGAIMSLTQASFLEPKNPHFYAQRGLTPSLITRQLLINRDDLMKSINDCDWESSEVFLKQAFNENPSYIKEHVEEFITLWCILCQNLVNQVEIKRLIPIFTKLFVIGERNKDLNLLVQTLFEHFDIDNVLELTKPKDKILIKLSYCQYNFLKEQFSKAEVLAIENIQNAASLIKNTETEDFGWLIVRRSLALCRQKDLSRTALTNLIANLEY
tara:strand:+ start:485 stop:1489 length:1005 start_codon:yes stop_codon:yes gene_type:complete